MSASRRLLGVRNASFAPQLGIEGLVSELTFYDCVIRLQADQNDIYTLLYIRWTWLSRQLLSVRLIEKWKLLKCLGWLDLFLLPEDLDCNSRFLNLVVAGHNLVSTYLRMLSRKFHNSDRKINHILTISLSLNEIYLLSRIFAISLHSCGTTQRSYFALLSWNIRYFNMKGLI